MTVGVLDVSNVEAAGVALDVLENTDTTDVVTTDDDHEGTLLVLDDGLDLTALEVKL